MIKCTIVDLCGWWRLAKRTDEGDPVVCIESEGCALTIMSISSDWVGYASGILCVCVLLSDPV